MIIDPDHELGMRITKVFIDDRELKQVNLIDTEQRLIRYVPLRNKRAIFYDGIFINNYVLLKPDQVVSVVIDGIRINIDKLEEQYKNRIQQEWGKEFEVHVF